MRRYYWRSSAGWVDRLGAVAIFTRGWRVDGLRVGRFEWNWPLSFRVWKTRPHR